MPPYVAKSCDPRSLRRPAPVKPATRPAWAAPPHRRTAAPPRAARRVRRGNLSVNRTYPPHPPWAVIDAPWAERGPTRHLGSHARPRLDGASAAPFRSTACRRRRRSSNRPTAPSGGCAPADGPACNSAQVTDDVCARLHRATGARSPAQSCTGSTGANAPRARRRRAVSSALGLPLGRPAGGGPPMPDHAGLRCARSRQVRRGPSTRRGVRRMIWRGAAREARPRAAGPPAGVPLAPSPSDLLPDHRLPSNGVAPPHPHTPYDQQTVYGQKVTAILRAPPRSR
jgi:hypothetical protein